jgi:hypothetical protein
MSAAIRFCGSAAASTPAASSTTPKGPRQVIHVERCDIRAGAAGGKRVFEDRVVDALSDLFELRPEDR